MVITSVIRGQASATLRRSLTAARAGGGGPRKISASICNDGLPSFAAAITTTSVRAMSTTIGQSLADLATKHPNMDVIRYEHKNQKWSFKHVEFFSECLATGFVDQGLGPGDAVLSWLPLHLSEQCILQFACSKAGMILYHLDPAQAFDDKEKAKASLSKALLETEATCLFTEEARDDVNYVQLCRQVIPEIRIFDFADGMPFITPRFPHLRFPIHTGFDINVSHGMVPMKQMLSPSGELDNLLAGAELTGKTPVCGELTIGADGMPSKGKVLTNEDVVKGKVWPHVSSILSKEYTEVEGVGVVF